MSVSDNEQMQAFKHWWKQYGGYIVIGVLVFSFSNLGWRYWQKYQERRLENASVTYIQLLVAFDGKKEEEVTLYAQHLMKNYPKSPYAALGALISAKSAIETGKLQRAQEDLQFILNKTTNKALRQIARIRKARLLLEDKLPQTALDLLMVVDDEALIAAISEIRGDILLALGKKDEAKKEYQKARDELKKSKEQSPLLEIKLRQF